MEALILMGPYMAIAGLLAWAIYHQNHHECSWRALWTWVKCKWGERR